MYEELILEIVSEGEVVMRTCLASNRAFVDVVKLINKVQKALIDNGPSARQGLSVCNYLR